MNKERITITGTIHRVQRQHSRAFVSQPPPGTVRRPARIAIMLALAHRIRDAVEAGQVQNQTEAARRLGYTPARMSQLLDLLLLAPDLQERVLLLEAVDGVQPLAEHVLRPIVRLTHWVEQRAAFRAFFAD
jgi:hypothetical protein